MLTLLFAPDTHYLDSEDGPIVYPPNGHQDLEKGLRYFAEPSNSPVLIGRDPACQVIIKSQMISRLHVSVIWSDQAESWQILCGGHYVEKEPIPDDSGGYRLEKVRRYSPAKNKPFINNGEGWKTLQAQSFKKLDQGTLICFIAENSQKIRILCSTKSEDTNNYHIWDDDLWQIEGDPRKVITDFPSASHSHEDSEPRTDVNSAPVDPIDTPVELIYWYINKKKGTGEKVAIGIIAFLFIPISLVAIVLWIMGQVQDLLE